MFRPRHSLLLIFLIYIFGSDGMKCRTGEEPQPNEDFEYVVRICLRNMRNNSDYFEIPERNQKGYDFEWNRRYKDRNGSGKNRIGNTRNRGSDGFERFWPNGKPNDRDRDRDRDRMEEEYSDESDYGPMTPTRSNKNRKKIMLRVPTPHTFQQQVQHDRDMIYGYGNNRDPQYYFHGNRNKNPRRPTNNDPKNESPLDQIDACVVHCIFQELQMLDESGKPEKSTVSIKMSQKIRNLELKSFIQDAVDECFDQVDAEESNSRYRGSDSVCMWSKHFAICLEEKGRQTCDDWNEPIQFNSNSDDQKNKQRGNKGNRG